MIFHVLASSNLKGRDFTHVESGDRVSVIDVRIDTSGIPVAVLVRAGDGVVEWMNFLDFNNVYVKVVPAVPAKAKRRPTEPPDDMDDMWNEIIGA